MDSLAADFDLRLSRYKSLNEERLKRGLSVVSPNVRQMLDILPLLLHFNTPNLPGCRCSNVPTGIDGFVMNKRQKQWLIDRGIDPSLRPQAPHSIFALYAMGSTSSIGQGVSSDLDIWVCISRNIPKDEVEILTEKCHFISTFFKTLGADINLFVTAEDRFTSGQHGTLDTEDCGSAQSLFLLDEFYRTSFKICGRSIIWYLVSPQEEDQDYYGTVKALYESGRVDNQLWFDFGSVVKSSAAEYFGSGLWLLYKGIDHPFKAVMKIMLMEAYANEYPKTRLLSTVLKDRMYKSNRYSLQLDAYYLMFKKVCDYLKAQKDFGRLELVRLCFFLKLHEGLKHLTELNVLAYRKKFLSRLCQSWGWSLKFQAELKSKEHWKIGFVMKLNTELFSALHKSYRQLLNFSIGHGIAYAITSDDAGVLSRKLYAAFDAYPGKVLLLNRESRSYLEEPYLSFIKPSQHSLCDKGWHVFPTSCKNLDILQKRSVYSSESLAQSVVWATYNKILTSRTMVDVGGDSGTIKPSTIKALSLDLRLLNDKAPEIVSESSLQQSRYIKKCLIVLNFERDPTVNFRLSQSDLDGGTVLCCGRQRECLIGSIDMITINSWGEIESTSFPDGEDGVVELFATLLRIHRLASEHTEKSLPCELVRSYSKNHGDLIRYDLEATLRSIFSCNQSSPEFNFDVGLNSYIARFRGERDVAIIRRTGLNSADFDISVLTRYGMRPEFALQVPSEVDRVASVGIMQYFFAPSSKGWDIYIVNERNEVRIFEDYTGSRSELVNSINRYYSRQSEESRGGRNLHFNLPQYFVMSQDRASLHPFTINL